MPDHDSVTQPGGLWSCPRRCGFHIVNPDAPMSVGDIPTSELIQEHMEQHEETDSVLSDPDAMAAIAEAEPCDPAVAKRAAFTAGLREIADWLDAHPEVGLPYLGAYANGSDLPSMPIYLYPRQSWDTEDKPDVRTQMATIARAMGTATKTPGRADGTFQVWRAFSGIAVFAQAARDEVCERVVIGSHEVSEEVPDPEAVAALPRVTVTKVVEDVEWRCGPLLGDTTEPAESTVGGA